MTFDGHAHSALTKRSKDGVHAAGRFVCHRLQPVLLGQGRHELGIEDQEGVVILQVRPESRAARIGFQAGDVIQQVGRKKIEAVSELEALLKERQQVWLVVLKRGNQTVRLQLAG